MSIRKCIYWRPDMSDAGEEKQFANVHLLVGYNQGCISDYQAMAAELRLTFPQAKDCELHCEKVRRSSSCDGFTLLTWNASIPRQRYPGWSESTWTTPGSGAPDYTW